MVFRKTSWENKQKNIKSRESEGGIGQGLCHHYNQREHGKHGKGDRQGEGEVQG